ncbi:hypothetical protein FPSE_00752 [Fusarium pseudograminearum CS3096]|uniref:Uncharacterized protein n=1 Tax=Fusarium pseudograminearum (strain CS3096) TaxID=1028729 RepID=K3V1Q3_FUSPC|nr:hypothetical protein FPSE_00752 [Fusarium pseudograminearum CS3096]EKJ79151.1 hypothetical protein FPSE_00752 [Fusarium pseudograminearum CS3096]
MTLRLAPYNDAMRLGQGFNSYTHELCIDQAVKVKQRKSVESKGETSQVVSYSARFVEKLSDVVESMNVSYSSAIKKGTIEISGNSSTVDETTFKSSHLNAVVAVKVVNQTISTEDECEFQQLENNEAAMYSRFNEIYGDSYISGFIEGGDFTGIVSIKVLDGHDVKSTVEAIKSGLNMNSKTEVEEFVLGPSDNSSRSTLATALKDTETTISISWIGGAQIKDASRAWDIDSMYDAAAAFPAAVAQCPQRTWAILTPYKANRSFVKWSTGSPVKTLQYDLIASFTAELFDSFMDYKMLLKDVQNIISNRKDYRQRIGVVDAIDTNLKTLLSVRGALRDEQTKIVEAIGVLSKDPSVLKRQGAWSTTNRVPLVKQIIEKALGHAANWEPKPLAVKPASAQDAVQSGSIDVSQAQKAESDDEVLVDSATSSIATPITSDGKVTATAASDLSKPAVEFNFDTLMPPEVWEDLLPEPIEPPNYGQVNVIPQATHPNSLLSQLMPPPDGSSGPGVVVSQSYDAMQRELESFRKEKLAAEKLAADAEAAREKQAREYAALNAQYAQYKADAERTQTSQASQISEKTSMIETKEAEIQRQKAAHSQVLAERDEAQARDNQKQNEINALKECALDGLTAKKITVITITYGNKVFYELGWTTDSFNLVPKVEQMIASRGSFVINDPWFGHDPMPNVHKQCTITYRFNTPGQSRRIRTMCAKQMDTGRFDAL